MAQRLVSAAAFRPAALGRGELEAPPPGPRRPPPAARRPDLPKPDSGGDSEARETAGGPQGPLLGMDGASSRAPPWDPRAPRSPGPLEPCYCIPPGAEPLRVPLKPRPRGTP